MSLSGLRASTIALVSATMVAVSPLAAEPVGLRGYNAAIGDSSISGISSGAFMAVQFGTAWSSVIKGVGVVAGGPFWCAKADADDFMNGYTLPIMHATGSCMVGPPRDMDDYLAKADAKAASGDIDPLQNLARQKIYLFHGTNDAVVARSVTDAAADFYRHYLGDAGRGNLYYQTAIGAGHSLVVLQQPAGNRLNDCKDNAPPYIDQCGYDQAGVILQHIYGALNPPNRGQLGGAMQRFDQSLYTKGREAGALSLGENGYVFVPKACEDGGACRVHIALHGCKQDAGEIGRRFIDDTGYNAWADTNHLIVLYPQTKASSYLPFNPQACWDWWSYVDHADSYVTKSGAQIAAIKAMLDTLTAGAAAPATPAPGDGTPRGLTIVDTSDTSAALAWTAQGGAMTYRVQRAGPDGAFVTVGDVKGPSFGDSGLAPQSTYRWRVAAVVGGVEGPPSGEVAAITRATPAPCDNPGSCPIGK
ncbi:extracellular catalytic domain type 2 short-chain-length polyhydroxyalkanoate depolymerase [Bradyrhizobium prioriisuperbiae]|uniref:extracellular catalytic domain type 2 short-chain-length polyhydroxyalkanoate depolymerase n=1 Tax=Bradyrhizobium prioriisuperbiae TaxID=2854389 RepID=UPI0028E25099|nr:PHB depolymerase family esterase [Bradyrhizobium prioritasuperba]